MLSRHQLTFWMLAALLFASRPGLAAHPILVVGTPANRMAEEVLGRLVSSPMGKAAPPWPWSVVLVQNPHLNAYVDAMGHIAITTGMAEVFGKERGLWAAVLGHEIGHFVVHRQFQAYLPGFQAELEKACRQARAAGGPDNGPVRLISLGGGSRRLARAREYEADRVGLMMMAQAGYHPDFAILLDQLLHRFFGDEPKLTEFLSSHPRWAEREERMLEDHDVAVAIFESCWPDPARAPGGPAPAFGTMGAITVDRGGESEQQGLTLHVPVEVRNAGSRQIRVEAVLLDKGRPVQSALAEYRAAGGTLVINVNLPHPPSEPADVALHVPAAALGTTRGKLKAEVFLIADDEILSLGFKPVDVDFSR